MQFANRSVAGLLLTTALCLADSSSLSVLADEPSTASFTTTTSDEGVLISEHGQPVAFYQRAVKSKDGEWPRSNYLHPVYDMDGNVFTEDFPEDHGHHRGIFWSWHQVWVGDKRMGDAWICRDFEWDVQSVVTEVTPNLVTLKSRVHWQSPSLTDEAGQRIPFVEETTVVRFHPQAESHRVIDFEITLLPLVDDVRIGGSEDRKGYGGFSPRIALTGDQTFLSQSGEVIPQVEAISAGPWLDISNGSSGIAIFDHPLNPGHPQPWILRKKRSMQNAAWPGRNPVPLSAETPTILRYRTAIHRNRLTIEQLDGLAP